MSGDEGSLPKSELVFQTRKCASCDAETEASDVSSAECGAELAPVGSSSSAPAAAGPLSDQLFAALAPRDALRVLLATSPAMLTDRSMFFAATAKLFANNGRCRARYLSVQSTGIMADLQGKSSVSAAEWEKLVRDLVDVCGFSRAVAIESAEEWCYALNVNHPSSKPVVASGSPKASEGGAKTAGQGPKFIGATIVVLLVCFLCWGVVGGRTTHVAGDVHTLVLPGNVNMEFVWCPAGTFTMGSPESELGREDDEVQHEVKLSHGFWMAKYPTTQRQYKALIGSNPSGFKGDDRPVEKVNWDEAVAFCEKVNERLGSALPEGFRCALPTEAQWEYACRVGTTSALNSGRELTSKEWSCSNLDAVAWYGENSGYETHAVGEKQANAWGLCDMHGNVWEWCSDWWSADYPTGSVTDPTGPVDGSHRVCRGGSSIIDALFCRSASRSDSDPSFCYYFLGFRPALVL